jgi:hypothetical protein
MMANGTVAQVFSNGVALPIARNVATGQFVGVAKAVLSANSLPLTVPINLATSALQMHQTHRGFTAVLGGINQMKNMLGALQATTALIGVGTIANVVISAVTLHKVLKLREDINQLRVEVKDGFVSLETLVKGQSQEIIDQIKQSVADIKFEQHRVALIQAYSKFIAAANLIQTTVECTSQAIRDADLSNARHLLEEALSNYRNPQLLSETSALGKLRRMECAWLIEQTIASTFEMQGEHRAVSKRLERLIEHIKADLVAVSNGIDSQEELDAIYPEIMRIVQKDLQAIELWKESLAWVQSLPPSELKELGSLEIIDAELVPAEPLNEVPEESFYSNIKPKSHFDSLREQVVLMALPTRRKDLIMAIRESEFFQQSQSLTIQRLDQASDLTISNLYYYVKN